MKSKPGEAELSPAVDAFTQFKNLLLPVTDGNPYLSEGTKQVFSSLFLLNFCFFDNVLLLCGQFNSRVLGEYLP